MGAGASRGEDARNARAAGHAAPYRGGLFQQQPLQPQQSHQPPPHQRPYAAQQQPHAQQQPPAQRAAVVTQQQHVRTADATIPRRGDPSPRRVSSLTDELLKCKAKLELAEQKLRDGAAGIPHTECTVCMDAPVDTVFLPCGHICICHGCCMSMQKAVTGLKCPLCRLSVDKAQRIYLPVHQPAPPEARRSPEPAAGAVLGATRATVSVRPGLSPADARVDAASLGARTPRSAAREAWPDLGAARRLAEPAGAVSPAAAMLSKTLPASFQLPMRHDITVPLR